MVPPGKRLINVEIPSEQHLALQRMAASEGQRSIASLVRTAISEFLQKKQAAPIPFPSQPRIEVPALVAFEEHPSSEPESEREHKRKDKPETE